MIKPEKSLRNKPTAPFILCVLLLALTTVGQVAADNVSILAAEFQRRNTDVWTVRVALKHADTGWDHYADNWRVVDSNGKVLSDIVAGAASDNRESPLRFPIFSIPPATLHQGLQRHLLTIVNNAAATWRPGM